MARAELLLSACLGAASAVLLLVVGLLLARRPRAAPHALAARVFASAWLCAGALAAVNATVAFGAAWGSVPAALQLAAAWAAVALGVAVVASLVAYLAYLLTGSRRAVPLVLGAYSVVLVALVVLILRLEPVGADSSGWMIRFEFAHASSRANQALALGVLVPGALASAGYLSLAWRVQDPTARWRVSLVGGSLAAWVLAAIVVRLPFVGDSLLGLARAAGALAALAIFVAYTPPAWLRRRLGVRGLHEEVLRGKPDPARRAEREEALARRAQELI